MCSILGWIAPPSVSYSSMLNCMLLSIRIDGQIFTFSLLFLVVTHHYCEPLTRVKGQPLPKYMVMTLNELLIFVIVFLLLLLLLLLL